VLTVCVFVYLFTVSSLLALLDPEAAATALSEQTAIISLNNIN